MSVKSLVAVAALSAAAYAGSASAVGITGGISFSNGFDSTGTTTSIVSQLVAVNVGNTTNGAFGCSGDFTGCPTVGAFASDFTIGMSGQLVYTYMGYTFTVNSFTDIVRTALACNGASCFDFLRFTGTGVVTKTGFDASVFTMNWTSQGNCTDSHNATPTCGGNVNASWSSSITALGTIRQTPEPATLALLGLGLAGLGFASRRKVR